MSADAVAINALSAAEALVARGVAPVKADYIRKPPVRDSGGGGSPLEAQHPAGNGTVSQERPQQSNQQQEGNRKLQKKSKRQLKRELKEQKKSKAELCHLLAGGNCKFGENCRFSHDVDGYVQLKPADLPGPCPFSCLPSCPFGITCRYASKHTNPDEITQRHVINCSAGTTATVAEPPAASTPTTAEAQIRHVRDSAGVAPAAEPISRPGSGTAAQEGSFSGRQAPETAAGNGNTGRAGSSAAYANGTCGQQIGTLSGNAVPVSTSAAAQSGSQEPIALPVADEILPTINVLDKSVQALLRRSEYDVAKADVLVRSLGGRVSHASRAQRSSAAGQAPEAADAPAALEGDALEPQAKRPRADAESRLESGAGVSTDPSATAAAAAAAAAAAPAAAAEAEPVKVFDIKQAADNNRAMDVDVPLRVGEKKRIDFRGKTYLAPLTTVGNLPFRRVCKGLGVDITCGEMALAVNLLQGQASEWALLKRHPCEDLYGVQVCGGYPDAMGRCAQIIEETMEVDFVDINMGCPIDIICQRSAGSALLQKPDRIRMLVRAMSPLLSCPLTFKTRKGYNDGADVAHTFLPAAASWGAAAVTLHGRTRQQRYSRLADWEYIQSCAAASPDLQLLGNGDVFSYTDYNTQLRGSALVGIMIGRAALIKPWIFTEIKEQRHWDISSSERMELLKQFCSFGLTHWGSDTRGVEATRRFLLEWLSFLHRYIPVGLLEVVPQQLAWRKPHMAGRDDLETLMASDSAADWVRISEMLLGPPPPNFSFAPKHKSNAYDASEKDMALGLNEGEENG